MTEYSDCTKLDELRERYPGLFDIIVIDTETTGLYKTEMVGGHVRKNYILQLSILAANDLYKDKESGETLNKSPLGLYDQYFKPRIKSWPGAEAVNHISYDMVKDRASFASQKNYIQGLIDKAKVIIGYNIPFDVGFLENSGIEVKPKYFIDVMEDYAVWFGDLHGYYHSFTWQSLCSAANRAGFNWESYPPHNSMSDCIATLHVARWLQKENKEKGWVVYYPPCQHYVGEYYCSECNQPCRLRDVRRVYDKGSIE